MNSIILLAFKVYLFRAAENNKTTIRMHTAQYDSSNVNIWCVQIDLHCMVLRAHYFDTHSDCFDDSFFLKPVIGRSSVNSNNFQLNKTRIFSVDHFF